MGGEHLANNRRQRRTCYALCHILYPVSAAHTRLSTGFDGFGSKHTDAVMNSSQDRRKLECSAGAVRKKRRSPSREKFITDRNQDGHHLLSVRAS